MVVLEKDPHTYLVAILVRGLYLEVRTEGPSTVARYVYRGRLLARPVVGRA